MSDVKEVAAVGSTTRVTFNANNGNNAVADDAGNGGDNNETPEAKEARLLEEKEFEGLSAEEIVLKKEEKSKAAEEAKKNEIPELNDAQIKAIMKQQLGDDWDGDINAAKEKLKKTVPELSAEEKAKQEAAHEKRMLDLYVEEGGTAQQFYQLKQIKEAALTLFVVTVPNRNSQSLLSDVVNGAFASIFSSETCLSWSMYLDADLYLITLETPFSS